MPKACFQHSEANWRAKHHGGILQLKRKIKFSFSLNPVGKQNFLPFPPNSLLSVLPSHISCRFWPSLSNEAVQVHSTQPDDISSNPLLVAVASLPQPTRQTWGSTPWETARHQRKASVPGTSGHPPERTVYVTLPCPWKLSFTSRGPGQE